MFVILCARSFTKFLRDYGKQRKPPAAKIGQVMFSAAFATTPGVSFEKPGMKKPGLRSVDRRSEKIQCARIHLRRPSAMIQNGKSPRRIGSSRKARSKELTLRCCSYGFFSAAKRAAPSGKCLQFAESRG